MHGDRDVHENTPRKKGSLLGEQYTFIYLASLVYGTHALTLIREAHMPPTQLKMFTHAHQPMYIYNRANLTRFNLPVYTFPTRYLDVIFANVF